MELSAELRGARAKLSYLTLQSDGVRGPINSLTAERDKAYAREVAEIGVL